MSFCCSTSIPAFGIFSVLDLLCFQTTAFSFKGGQIGNNASFLLLSGFVDLLKPVLRRFMFRVWEFSGNVAELFLELCSSIDVNMSPSFVVKLAV